MKKKWMKSSVVLACAGLLAATTAEAQPRRGDREGPERGRQRERAEEGPRQDRPMHVEQWLEQVRESDPAEYERLIALRADHPMAFRMEMRQRLQEGRVLRVIRDEFPGFYSYLQDLDQEERDRLGHFLQRMAENRPGAAERPRSRFADMEGDVELRRLARDWRRGQTPDDQAALESTIRSRVEQLFDERTAAQEREVEQLERQLQQLRTMLETRQTRREQWVEQVMQRLTATPEEDVAEE